jgi:peptide/nickel transport system substrate-binding protein
MSSRYFVVALVAAIAAGCTVLIPAASGSYGHAYQIAHLNIRTHAMYGSLDPGYTQNCFSTYCRFFYERLLGFNAQGQVVPQLALSIKNPVPDTYDITLRRGVKFWDGSEMTSDDVANSLNYERFPKFNSSIALRIIKNVKPLSKYVVRVSLRHPDASFGLQLAASGMIFSKKFQQAAGENFGKPGTLTMATGPFRPTSFDGKTKIELVANPRWWGGKVNVGSVTINLITDDTAAALAIRSGQIDAGAGYGDPRAMASALGSAGTVTKVVFGTAQKYWSMNVKQPPFDDIHFRRAVAYATNRAEYIAAEGGGVPLTTMITPIQLAQIASPAQINTLLKSLNTYPFSIAKAKAELAQSKYASNVPKTSINCPPFGINACQVLSAQLGRVGIPVQVNEVPTLSYVNEIYGPKTFGWIYGYIGCIGPDPSGCVGYTLGSDHLSQINTAQYAPPDLDKLLAEGVRTLNKAKRFAIYSQILKRLAQDVPYVPYALPVYSVMVSNKYTWPGLAATKSNIIFDSPWVLNLRPK